MRDETPARPRVVCVHGAGGGGWEWSIWARVLVAHGWSVIAPDLRPIAAGLAATHFADYRDQVAAWCVEPREGVILIGASLGARLALSVAADVGAAALVLVNSPAPEYTPASPAGGIRPAVIPWRSQGTLAGTQRAMPDADDAACMYAFRRWRDESGAALDEAERPRRAGPLRCRVLVIASDADRDVPLAASWQLAANQGADFMRIAGASHVGPLLGHSAAATAAAVARWLADARGAHA